MTLLSAGEVAPGSTVKTVAVDLSRLSRGDFEKLDGLGLENRATVRLVQEGFAVVSLRSSPSILLRVLGQRDSLLLLAASGDRQARRRVRRNGAPTAELHLEVAQKLVELAREVWVEPPAPEPVVEAPPPLAPAPPPAVETAPAPAPIRLQLPEPPPAAPPSAPPSPSHRASVGGGALVRDGGIDGLVVASVQGAAPGLRPAVLLGFAPSGTGPLRVFEGQLQAGVAIPWSLREDLELAASLLVGVAGHLYRPSSPLVSPEGVRVDLLASSALELTWNPVGGLVLSARVAPGVSTRSRSHLEGEQVLWSRSAWRVETGVAVGWSFH